MCYKGSIQVEMYDKPQDDYGSTAFIYGLWVNEPYRRQGVANTLLYEAEQYIRKCGHKKATLQWNERDTPREVLEHLYLNNGYEDVEFGRNSALLIKKL